MSEQFAHVLAFARLAGAAHANLIHVEQDAAGMQALDKGFGRTIEDFIQFRFAHADRYLRGVDDHRVVPAYQQLLAVVNAAAGKDTQRRRGAIGMIEIELRILQAGEVFVFLERGLAIFALDAQRRSGAAEDIDGTNFLDREIVEPELAGLAAPDARIEVQLVKFEAIDQHAELSPVAGAWDVELPRGNVPVAGKHEGFECVGRLKLLGLDPDAYTVATVRPDSNLPRGRDHRGWR